MGRGCRQIGTVIKISLAGNCKNRYTFQMNKLTKPESDRKKQLEQVIKKGLATFCEVALALKEIQEKQYFKDEYDTFELYCRGEYGMSYSYAWKLIQAADIQATIPEIKLPNESVAREVGKIAIPQRRQIVSKALEQSAGKLTVPAIKSVLNQKPEGKKKAVLPKDGTGLDIPPEIQIFWDRNEEANHILSMVSKVRITIEKWANEDDLIGKFVPHQDCISKLKMLYENLKCAKSYAVCPKCNGVLFSDCKECRGRGSLPEFFWNMVPEETKKLRS